MAVRRIRIDGDDVSVSLLVWRTFRKPMDGMAEAIFASNPGLAVKGVMIPVGTVVTIPDVVQQPTTVAETPISLWD